MRLVLIHSQPISGRDRVKPENASPPKGIIRSIFSPIRRFDTHLEDKRSTGRQIIVRQVTFIILLPVERRTLDIDILRTVVTGFDHKRATGSISRVQTELHPDEYRTGDLLAAIARTYRMYAGSRQHIPSRHLPDIFVSYQAGHFVVISVSANVACPFLGKRRHP